MNVEKILIQGEIDRHVPVDLSVDYYKEAVEQGDKIRLIILPEVEH
ncbi:MAG TPA: hypothetical protein VK044_09960 [Virgibacillus sp.]|nr:hypothetical protein [Virgibacillus sp.]